MFRFKQISASTIIFWVIIIIASILRLWHISSMHLSNDELSALSRTMVTSLQQLFSKGIIPDGHPALTQIFLYLYAPLVKYNDLLLKLPFVLSGIVAIIIMYKAVKTMTGNNVALATISFIAISQPFVYYSQLARPYAFGMLETSLVIYFVAHIIYSTPSTKHFWGLSISIALSAYTHYFAFLTSLTFVLLAFPYVSKSFRKKYFISIIIALLLFVPHLPITIKQLGYKGLAWLPTPTMDSCQQILFYYFNYSHLLLAIITLLLLIFILYKNKVEKKLIPITIISFGTLIIVLTIEYLYSIYRAPVLQFSALLFAFQVFTPFLFISWQNIGNRTKLLLSALALIIISGSYSLIAGRKHYQITYHSPFYNISHFYSHSTQSHNNAVPLVVVQNNPFYTQKYLIEAQINLSNNYYLSLHPYEHPDRLINFLDTIDATEIVFGNTQPPCNFLYTSYIREKFPYIKDFNEDAIMFSKHITQTVSKKDFILDTLKAFPLHFNSFDTFWQGIQKANIKYDSLAKRYYLDRKTEWGVAFSQSLNKVLANIYNLIIVKISFVPQDTMHFDIKLVGEIKNKEKSKWWSSISFRDLYKSYTNKKLYSMYMCVYPYDLNIDSNDIIKTYLWNSKQKHIKIYDFQIFILKGKPNPYALFQQIESYK